MADQSSCRIAYRVHRLPGMMFGLQVQEIRGGCLSLLCPLTAGTNLGPFGLVQSNVSQLLLDCAQACEGRSISLVKRLFKCVHLFCEKGLPAAFVGGFGTLVGTGDVSHRVCSGPTSPSGMENQRDFPWTASGTRTKLLN